MMNLSLQNASANPVKSLAWNSLQLAAGIADDGLSVLDDLGLCPEGTFDAYRCVLQNQDLFPDAYQGRRLRINASPLARAEQLVRSRLFGLPFVLANAVTRWEVYGRENLAKAQKLSLKHRIGVKIFSEHQSIWDDPTVPLHLAGRFRCVNFTRETKCWYSTPAAANFNPEGNGFRDWLMNRFSDVSAMIFIVRPSDDQEKGPRVVKDPRSYLESLFGKPFMKRLRDIVAEKNGVELDAFLESLYTRDEYGDAERYSALNQAGMFAAAAALMAGFTVWGFPRGTRARDEFLDPALYNPKPGVAKIAFHSGAILVPVYIYGMQKVFPRRKILPFLPIPMPGHKVVVVVGEPILPEDYADLREQPASVEAYSAISQLMKDQLTDLRPFALRRALGVERANVILDEEARSAYQERPTGALVESGSMIVGQPTQSVRSAGVSRGVTP